jgi:selenide,water dikinase
MAKLNKIGQQLAGIKGIAAMTDVTGFGLLGHLTEICEGSQLSAKLNYNKVPIFDEVEYYLEQKCVPGGTTRNWDSYGEKVRLANESYRDILCDPQTSGGLLIAVEPDSTAEVENLLKASGIYAQPFGELVEQDEFSIYVK